DRQRALLRGRGRRLQRRAPRLSPVRRAPGPLSHGARGLAALRAVRRPGQPGPARPGSGRCPGPGEVGGEMALERKKTLNVFKDAAGAFGSYDDYPVGPPGIDPMPHLSRNRIAQPFYLVSEADQVLIQMAGEGEILFAEREVVHGGVASDATPRAPAEPVR